MKCSQIVARIIIIGGLIIVPMYGCTLWKSHSYLEIARSFESQGSMSEAFAAYRKAISWSSPFNTASRQAQSALKRLGFDASRPPEERLHALEELLRGLQSSRSFLSPRRFEDEDREVGLVKKEIELLTHAPAPAVRHESTLRVNYTAQILGQVLFLGWIIAALWTIYHGFQASGRINARSLAKGSLLTLMCYALWLVALAI